MHFALTQFIECLVDILLQEIVVISIVVVVSCANNDAPDVPESLSPQLLPGIDRNGDTPRAMTMSLLLPR